MNDAQAVDCPWLIKQDPGVKVRGMTTPVLMPLLMVGPM